jgi:hypothetical protein
MPSRRQLLAAGLLLPFAAAAAPALLAALRAGGRNLYFRHSLTQRLNQPDNDFTNCATQRNLTEEGRRVAQDIGAAIRELGIPVGEVLSSPYCRCVDTAALAFGQVSVVPWLETNGKYNTPPERARLAELARVLRAPLSGGNRVLSAHGNNLYGMHEVYDWDLLPIQEGECVVYSPAETPEVLGRVVHNGWRMLAA